jgi:hypothetical protein
MYRRLAQSPALKSLLKPSSPSRFISTMEGSSKIKPAARVSNQKQDVWYGAAPLPKQ